MMKVCILDDDHSSLQALQLALSPEHQVRAFATIPETVLSCQVDKPEVLILDYDLGFQTGFQAHDQITSKAGNIPTILVTGVATKEIAIQSINRQLHGFLEKPISVSALNDLLALLNSPKRRDMLELNPHELTATLDGQSARLTKTEFTILKIIYEERGRSINREDLSLRVWGEAKLSRNTLDTHLFNIKNKIPALRERLVARIGVGFFYKSKK